MINKFKVMLLSTLMMFSVLFVPAGILVGHASAAPSDCTKSSSRLLGFPTWYKYLNFVPNSADCDINFDYKTDIGKVLLAVFEILLRVAGLAAVGYVIYGGFQYLISQGEPDKLKGAKSTIINALIGLVIAVSATAIVNLIGGSLIK